MNNATKTLLVTASALVLSSCGLSAPTKASQVLSGTAKTVFSEAELFVKETYPSALLVGYNNHGATIDRLNFIPPTHTTGGQSDHWFFLFARTPDLLNDKEFSDTDAVTIEFSKGTLTLHEVTTARDITVDENATTGAALLATDSDLILEKVVNKIEEVSGTKPALYHVDFRALPGINETTIFTSDTGGFDAKYDYRTGEVSMVRNVSFN